MSCLFDKTIIQKYADNTIEPLEFLFLKEHIGYCEECRRETELTMALENSLEKFFAENAGTVSFETMIVNLVDDCMYEVNRREKLKYVLKKRIEVCGSIIDNSKRFFAFIPGSKRINKGVKKTASGVGGFLAAFLKKKIVKLLEEVTWDI